MRRRGILTATCVLVLGCPSPTAVPSASTTKPAPTSTSTSTAGAGATSAEPTPSASTEETTHPLFPAPSAIASADPSVRTPQVVEIPTKLSLKRKGTRVEVSLDGASSKKIELKVGKGMILGTEEAFYVVPEKEPRSVLLSSGPPPTGDDDFLDVGAGKAEIEVSVTVFQTDIPAQHHWMPKSPKYEVLGTWRLRGTVPAK